MSITSSKSCLIEIINYISSPKLNFITAEWLTKINSASSINHLYNLIIELNSILAPLPITTLAGIPGSSCINSEITQYSNNAGLFMQTELSQITTLGTISNLNTFYKADAASAINELKSQISPADTIVSLSSLSTSSKTSLVAAINELNLAIGPSMLSNLYTYDKTSLVGAINEAQTWKYAFSLGLCINTAILKIFPINSGTNSPSNALTSDLANLFSISSSLYSGTGVNSCIKALHCIEKVPNDSLCTPRSFNDIQAGCSGSTLSSTCDKTWFCNLNKFYISYTGGVAYDDGDMFSQYASKEICPHYS